jgi:hypothetical protein
LEKPLDIIKKSSNEEHNDCIDYSIHIGRHIWDISCLCFDGDPVYDIDDDSRKKNVELFHLEHTYMYINYSDFGKYEGGMFTHLFQPYRSDPLQHSHDEL